MTHVSTFSGIGGIDLAAEWAGFTTVSFCEINKFCQKVLSKNFPGVPIHDDITTFDGSAFRGCTLLSGGFPCQDISQGNSSAQGIDGDRSKLVWELLRVVSEALPSWVIIENSPRLLTRGYDRVESSLRSLGYTVQPVVLEAGDVGTLQKSERVFVIAAMDKVGSGATLYPKFSNGLHHYKERCSEKTEPGRHHIILRTNSNSRAAIQPNGTKLLTPVFCGSIHGVPDGLDRLRALGNCVIPHQVYPILKVIADVEGGR